MKFLKTKSAADNLFEWPRKDDITSVNRQFIIAGPLTLQGAGPTIHGRQHQVTATALRAGETIQGSAVCN